MKNSPVITRRSALALTAAGFAAPLLVKSAVAEAAPVLVELFTSQGCSSCPPADKIAGHLKDDPNIIMVSLNVDYWDYLGWRDTLASHDFTQRQMDYAHARDDNDVYTPQMVINGENHAVGSNLAVVESTIANARRAAKTFALAMRATDKELVVDLPKAESNQDGTLWIMAIAPTIKVKIERGENSGMSVVYHNVVRKLMPAGMWDGSASSVKLPLKAILSPDIKMIVAVLQKDKAGPVLGLAQWKA